MRNAVEEDDDDIARRPAAASVLMCKIVNFLTKFSDQRERV